MLLLDEPTNHLDAESVDWLEQFLARFSGTVVAITHDRYFLDNAAEWILELDRGHGIPYKGNYSTWLEQKEARLEQEQRTEDARTKAMKKELEPASGLVKPPKAVKPRARPVWPALKNCLTTNTKSATKHRKFSFLWPRLGS